MDISDFKVKFVFDSQIGDMVWLSAVLRVLNFLGYDVDIPSSITIQERVKNRSKSDPGSSRTGFLHFKQFWHYLLLGTAKVRNLYVLAL